MTFFFEIIDIMFTLYAYTCTSIYFSRRKNQRQVWRQGPHSFLIVGIQKQIRFLLCRLALELSLVSKTRYKKEKMCSKNTPF